MLSPNYPTTYMSLITGGVSWYLNVLFLIPILLAAFCNHYPVTLCINLISETPPTHPSHLTFHSCIYSFKKFVLSTSYMPGTILGSEDTPVNMLSRSLYFE